MPSNPRVRLDAIKQDIAGGGWKVITDTDGQRSIVPDESDWAAIAAQLVTALEAVLDVHKPIRDSQEWCDADGLSWPCPTIRAITDALDAPLTLAQLPRACPDCRQLTGHTPTCPSRIADTLDALGGDD